MLVSYKWVCEIAGFSPEPKELANKLTFSGLEVDALTPMGLGFENIVVGTIVSKEPHPQKEKLSCVVVDSGEGEIPVVCGAPNCPDSGSRVVLAKIGANVDGTTIEARELLGAPSEGMLCSEDELCLGPDKDGIILLDGETDVPSGTPIVEALNLEDWIFELGITPNRPDALSHRGIAREICLLYGKKFDPENYSFVGKVGTPVGDWATVEILDDKSCPRYAASVITEVNIGPSSFRLRYRLFNLSIRPISNLVDITNLVLLEWGQPLHAFDLDKLSGKKIIVRKAEDGEKMVTLDEETRTFCSKDLLICDGEGPVALAGVMGGLDTGVTSQTKNVLIECAYFEPAGIRRTSKRFKLSSESSYRFERGVDPAMGQDVLKHVTGLVQELAGGCAGDGVIDCYPKKIVPKRVILRPTRFDVVMGYSVNASEMKRILEGLGASVELVDDKLSVDVPTSRPDIEREIDLIEEIARVTGLDKVPSILPRIQCTLPEREEYEAVRRARETMAELGLEDSITYSFVPEEMLVRLSMDKNIVKIANPLNSERAAMRTTLLVGLLENLKRANSRYVPLLKQFEVGRTFEDKPSEKLPREVLRVAALMSGPADSWLTESRERLDFFDIKGVCTSFIDEMFGMTAIFQPVDDIDFLHPQKAASIVIDGKSVGFIGEIHPSVLLAMKLPRGAVCMEIEFMKLWHNRVRSVANPLSEFPPMTRDVAFLVNEDQDTGPIAEALMEKCGPLAVNVSLFDVYRGKGIEEGSKSIAFSIVYRSWERTLTDEEVDNVHQKNIGVVANVFEAKLR